MLGTGEFDPSSVVDGGVAALRVDTSFSVFGLDGCELIGTTVDGYFIVHASAPFSASNQTRRPNHLNDNNTNDNEATNWSTLVKGPFDGQFLEIDPQTSHRSSTWDDELTAPQVEVHPGSLGLEMQ